MRREPKGKGIIEQANRCFWET